MQECVFLYKAEMDHGSKGLALGHRFGRADNEFLNGPNYCGLAPIFFTVDWTSEAASLHVCETSWLLATAIRRMRRGLIDHEPRDIVSNREHFQIKIAKVLIIPRA